MADASTAFHEPVEWLSPETLESRRGIVSLQEELEAIDWYAQRIDTTQDLQLKALLEHNRDEEKEHTMMTLEWLRRCGWPLRDCVGAVLFYRVESYDRTGVSGPGTCAMATWRAIVWAPAVDGAVVMSMRGGDFILYVGQDFLIGYSDHDDKRVRLYIQSSLTSLIFGPEAAVPLRHSP